VGYNSLSCDAKVLIIVHDGREVSDTSTGNSIELIVDKTPFYGEAGGQVGDCGMITGKDFEAAVNNTIKDPTGLIIHRCEVVSGVIKKGDTVNLSVDKANRDNIARNHTATHILHAVLRTVLGDHVKQSGSLVAPDRLRFDFTHFSQVDIETLNKIEALVNERIRENVPASLEEMGAEEAFKSGATALFEEKYGDQVRVISLSDFSKELCGGTHTARTGDIGLFKIVAESSVAAGIRRIEAITGESAVSHVQRLSEVLQKAAEMVKDKPETVVDRLEKIISDQKKLEKQVEQLRTAVAAKSAEDTAEEIKEINGIKVIVKKVAVEKPSVLRDLADRFKDKIKSGVVVLGSISGPRVLLIAGVTKDLVDRYHAGEIIKQVAVEVGGSGGGRPDMAQAGGTRPEKLDQALEKAYEVIKNSSF